MKRVVITGIGAVTPLASNFFDSWRLVRDGISGIDEITKISVSDLQWKMAGEIKDFNPELFLSKKEVLRLDPFVHYAVAAATMAFKNTGERTQNTDLLKSGGVIIGSSRGGITSIENELHKLYLPHSLPYTPRFSPYLMPSTTISMAASHIAQKLGIKGHCLGISNACASGANAIGEAFRLIRHGYTNMVFAGAAEAPICRLCVEGYGMSGALSKTNNPSASSPFDKSRDGFIIAEGACVLVLQEHESALKRKARIYAEIIGYSNTTDAFHITRPEMQGEMRAMHDALKDAGVSPEDVDYVNAHGTSTPIGDKIEAEAIKRVFKNKLSQIPVSSIKSVTGHMLAASGAFEAACTAMSINEGIIPPTMNLTEQDTECDINIIKEKPSVGSDIKIAITNSFGFGGVNAVIVLKRFS